MEENIFELKNLEKRQGNYKDMDPKECYNRGGYYDAETQICEITNIYGG